jgi:putative DNA primase/helicase
MTISLPKRKSGESHMDAILRELKENPHPEAPVEKTHSHPMTETEQRLYDELQSEKKKNAKSTPRESFSPASIVGVILAEQHIITDQNTDLIFLYNKNYGYYDCVNSIPLLKTVIQNQIGDKTKINHVKEVIDCIKRKTYRNIQRFDTKSEYVCLNNGILNLNTMEMEKHDPSRFISYRIPVERKQVDQEPWLHYVESSVHKDDLLKLQESVGNVFANHYETKKLTYIYGGNDSGKSTFLNILEDFLSPDNCSHLTLTQLSEKFTNAELYGKRANIYADVPYRIKLRYFGIIKNVTGGDPVTLQFKGKDAFKYKSISKQFFSANGIPDIDDKEADDAFYRRWEFIRFPHTFDPDSELFKKYTTPDMKSAILQWAIEGYQRLKQNHWKLTNQTSIDEAREKFEGVVLEPSGMWLLERTLPESTAVETKKALFEDCKEWHSRKLLPFIDNYDSFCKWIHNQKITTVRDYKPIMGEKREPSFVGIRLKPRT